MDYITLVHRINKFIFNPLIVLMFSVAAVVFLWGIFQFLLSFESDEAREKGKRNMVWGLIGMFIMVAVYGIIRLLLGTFNIPIPAEL